MVTVLKIIVVKFNSTNFEINFKSIYLGILFILVKHISKFADSENDSVHFYRRILTPTCACIYPYHVNRRRKIVEAVEFNADATSVDQSAYHLFVAVECATPKYVKVLQMLHKQYVKIQFNQLHEYSMFTWNY